MSYTCHYCEQESAVGKTITQYNEEGIEEQLHILCDTCYEDWLLGLKS